MTGTLVDAVRSALRRSPASLFRCPECGSLLDAARPNPLTGTIARRCGHCREWYPTAGARPVRSE
jgi:hypothetical protein